MSVPAASLPPPAPLADRASSRRELRWLFLTLFLRGRTSRGLQKQTAPASVGRKLAVTLVLYVLIGGLAVFFLRQPIFILSAYLHAMTFAFLGMFVASSAGEILFNSEEADILLHRPIAPRDLLWAKVRVLVEVSLWLAVAFNLIGFGIGLAAPDSGWLFPVAHLISLSALALFTTSCVVMVYQLCLRWFGRQRLDGLMTTAQVGVSVAAVLGGQLVPQLLIRTRGAELGPTSRWLALLPPAWFAGIDDVLSGNMQPYSCLLAALALASTGLVLWIAFGKLARDYEIGLQMLNETVSRPSRTRRERRWLERFVDAWPMRWWLRDPVERASFLLSAAYLFRDRDVKLRIYPGLAPFLAMPVIMLAPSLGSNNPAGGFPIAFAGIYVGMIPLLGLMMLQYSQQWQAADIFRVAPLPGPEKLCHGARRAVACILTLPLLAVFALTTFALLSDRSHVLLLLPGVIALPVYAIVPNLGGKGLPLSLPADGAKAAGRSLIMMLTIFSSMGLSALALAAWWAEVFVWFLAAEALIAAALYALMRWSLREARWPSLE